MAMAEVQILRAACCVAGLDGRVCDREAALLQRLAEHAGVGAASLNAMIELAQKDPNFYQQQFHVLKTDPEATMRALFCVAVADGALAEEERVILRHFADLLGLPPGRFEQLLALAEKHVAGQEQGKAADERG